MHVASAPAVVNLSDLWFVIPWWQIGLACYMLLGSFSIATPAETVVTACSIQQQDGAI